MQIFQGTALSLILRFSRTTAEVPYLASVAVIWTELIKLVICIVAECLVCRRTAREKGVTYLREVQNDLQDIIATSVPMVVPAALFVMQQVGSVWPLGYQACLAAFEDNLAAEHMYAAAAVVIVMAMLLCIAVRQIVDPAAR